jgi:uncharacterized damage-inducible protein DinB
MKDSNTIPLSGARAALQDEYTRAVAELKQLIAPVTEQQLPLITDPLTTDDNCRSIQSMLTHVVHAGYGYATSIHNLKGPARIRPDKAVRSHIKDYLDDLDGVLAFTESVLANFEDRELDRGGPELVIPSNWGQTYDPEQMLEHAIVHILRHRRQLARIIAGLDTPA